MSIESDFFFNIPKGYDSISFTQSLDKNLGLHFQEKNESDVYTGNCLGLLLSFDPQHDLEDDGEFVVSNYSSSIGLTGYAGAGQIRIIQLQSSN